MTVRPAFIRNGLSILGITLTIGIYVAGGGPGWDTYAYWRAGRLDPYQIPSGFGAFHYAPPILDLARLAGILPWPAFYWGLTAISASALLWMGRSWSLALLAFPPVAVELYQGNIHILLAAAVVIGLRWSPAWALPILTKITPGVGLAWFLVRREWRNLTVALGVTAAVALLSVVLQPQLWLDWARHLEGAADPAGAIEIPLVWPVRAAMSIMLIAWGGLNDRRWTVVVGAMWAMPILGIGGFAMLAGLVPLQRWESIKSETRRRSSTTPLDAPA